MKLVPDGVDCSTKTTAERIGISQHSMLDKHLAGSNNLRVHQCLNLLQTPIQRPWHYVASMLYKLECGMYSMLCMERKKMEKKEN